MKFNRRLSADTLKEDLRKQIVSGTLKPGALVMSGHELVKKYHLSYQTVTRAVCDLTAEGLLCRIRGKGTFVSEGLQKDSKLVGLFIRTEGHVYESISRFLVDDLQKEGFFPVPINIRSEKFKRSPEELIADVLKLEPSALIIEGLCGFPFECVTGLSSKVDRLIFIDRFDSDLNINADYVLSDYTRGGYIATRHLLSLGHRRILFHTYRADDIVKKGIRPHWQMRQGHLTALQEFADGEKSAMIFEIENREEEDRGRLKALFSKRNRPSAVISLSDYHARMIYSVLKELGLKVPDDVALVGYWNTPWAEATEVPLTSVSIKESKIAQKAAACLTSSNDMDSHVRILIEPKLVIRSSCGAKAEKSEEETRTGTEDWMM